MITLPSFRILGVLDTTKLTQVFLCCSVCSIPFSEERDNRFPTGLKGWLAGAWLRLGWRPLPATASTSAITVVLYGIAGGLHDDVGNLWGLSTLRIAGLDDIASFCVLALCA